MAPNVNSNFARSSPPLSKTTTTMLVLDGGKNIKRKTAEKGNSFSLAF